MIDVNIEAYFKDRYWNGWWWDRGCLYDHPFNGECQLCKIGSWYYTSPSKTALKRFGGLIQDHIEVYADGRVYMQKGRGAAFRKRCKKRKKK